MTFDPRSLIPSFLSSGLGWSRRLSPPLVAASAELVHKSHLTWWGGAARPPGSEPE